MRRLSDERGQASVEFAGILFWLVLTAFVVWQLLLVTWTFNQASNAARTASRVDGRGGDAVKAGRAALSPGLRDGARIRMSGETATVRVEFPIIVPGLHIEGLAAERKATLPG
jgi:membrane-associated protease RseP (regulator of RpoE activity)